MCISYSMLIAYSIRHQDDDECLQYSLFIDSYSFGVDDRFDFDSKHIEFVPSDDEHFNWMERRRRRKKNDQKNYVKELKSVECSMFNLMTFNWVDLFGEPVSLWFT